MQAIHPPRMGKQTVAVWLKKSSFRGENAKLSASRLAELWKGSLWWLADQEVHVFGHDYVSDQCKFMPAANLIQNLCKTIAGAHSSQVGPLPVTTERHKMKIAPSVKSLQRIALAFHRSSSKSKPAPLNTKGAAPACTLASNRGKCANDILLPCG